MAEMIAVRTTPVGLGVPRDRVETGPHDILASLSTVPPTLKHLVRFVAPRIAAVWYDVGLQLDLEPHVLDEIEAEKSCGPRKMFSRWLQGSSCSWQSVLDAVKNTCGVKPMQDIRKAVEDVLLPVEDALLPVEDALLPTQTAVVTTGSQDGNMECMPIRDLIKRKRHRSSSQGSEEPDLQEYNARRLLHDYMQLKMDLLRQDISDLHSESDPYDIIRLLYNNALDVITKLLAPHLEAVKRAANRYCRLNLHHVMVADGMIASAASIEGLLNQMSVTEKWDNTRFLRKAVGAIPHSAPERGVAEAILSHYNLHLVHYERATLLKRKKSESEGNEQATGKNDKLVPLEITVSKAFSDITCEDCHHLQVHVLSTAYDIPEESITYYGAEERHSTTITFLIPRQYTSAVMQRNTQLDAVWVLLELDVIEVAIPEVLSFKPSVDCFLTLLRESRTFTVDLLAVTEVLPYQMYAVLDSDVEPLMRFGRTNSGKTAVPWDALSPMRGMAKSLAPVPAHGRAAVPKAFPRAFNTLSKEIPQPEGQRSQTNVSMHSIRKEPWHGVENFPYRSLVLFHTFLLLLSIFHWLLVQGAMGSQTPTLLLTLSTCAVWLAYVCVCCHWLYVMVEYLSCLTVIKRSFCQIWQTVQKCSGLNFPKSILLGILCLVIVALAVVSEVLRCKLSISKWAYQDWNLCLAYLLMVVHAVALICQGLFLCGACIAPDTTRDTKEGESVPWFHDSFGYLWVINVFLLVEHTLFIFYADTDILELLSYGLIVYHAGSCCIIVVLLDTRQEIAVPSDAASSARNDYTGVSNLVWLRMEQLVSLCSRVCHLIKSEPVKGTLYLIYIMAALGIVRALDKRLSIPNMYSTILFIVYRCFSSFTLAVANYYIWKFLTNPSMYQTARKRKWSVLTCSFLVVIVLLGVAEISCSVTDQISLSFGIENVALDLTLLITGFMNAVLVLHEGYATFLLAIQKVCIGKRHSDNASKIIELMLTLNWFYAAFGIFTSILEWNPYKYSSALESVVSLLGHMACSVLMPAMVFPVIERMRENVNLDIQPVVADEYRGETAEHGSQESSSIPSSPTEWHEEQSEMYWASEA